MAANPYKNGELLLFFYLKVLKRRLVILAFPSPTLLAIFVTVS